MGLFGDWFKGRKSNNHGKENFSTSDSDASDYETRDDTRNSRHDGWRIHIEYADIEGALSARWVRVYRLETRQFADYLVGHCELRGETRTFRLDRIKSLADANGELHEPRDFFAPYLEYPAGRSAGADRHTPFGRALHIIDRIGDEMRLLAFVAEADGKIGNKEANLIMRIVELRASDIGFELKKSEIVDLRRWMKLQRPDENTMHAAISRMARSNSDSYDEVWSLVEIIAEADGKIAPAELEALRSIRSAMDAEYTAARATP